MARRASIPPRPDHRALPTRRLALAVGAVLAACAVAAGVAPQGVAAIAPVSRAAPTCTPAAPAVVGSGAGRLTVTVPHCGDPSALTASRVLVYADGDVDPTDQIDVPPDTAQVDVNGLATGLVHRFRVASVNADGQGPASPLSAAAVAPFTSLGALVDRQYADFAGRAPTSSERSSWIAGLEGGDSTGVDAVIEAERQPYWQKQSPVIRLYQAYFLRRPDLGGLDYWAGRHRAGVSLNQISQAFSASPEFRTLYGTLTNRQFVERIYQNILGRPGEPAGLAYWTGELDSRRRGRGAVMVGFSESPEYRGATQGAVDVINLTTGMLRRVPTAAEVTAGSGQPQSERVSALLDSDAYAARVGVTAPAAPPAVVTTSLPSGRPGTAYPSTRLISSAGHGVKTWRVSAGALPAGLSLSSQGVLTGTPTATASTSPTFEVRDARGQVGTRQLAILVSDLGVATSSLPAGAVGVGYTASLAATGGSGAKTWRVASGALPSGLVLSSTGAITGTPTATGTATFTVEVADATGAKATRQLQITVSNLAITTPSVPGGQVGVPYAFGLTAQGASAFTWSITAGSLPAGLALGASTGTISGTPTGAGSSTFTVKAASSAGDATKQLTLVVGATVDWPQLRHDDERRGWAPTETVLTPANVGGIGVEWAIETGLTPVLAGGLAYAAGPVPGRMRQFAPMALDVSTGDVVWTGPPLPGSCGGGTTAVTATLVLVSCSGLLAYRRAAPHDLVWSTSDTDPGSSVGQYLVSGTTAITWTSAAVTAYRMSDGQRLWQVQVAGSLRADPAASGGTVVFADTGTGLRAIDMATGAQSWARADVTSLTSLVLADGWVYTNQGAGVVRYALATGATGWSVRAGGDIYRVLGADGDTVYVWEAVFDFSSPVPSILHALRTSDGGSRWQYDVPSRVRDLAITGDLVWVTSSEIYSQGRQSHLIALRRSDGAEREVVEFGDNQYGSASFANGRVLLSQGGSSGGPDPARLRAYGLAPAAPTITTRMVPTGRVGTAYPSTTLTATGGSGSYTWALVGGTLPAGLTMTSAGVLSGTPTASVSSRIQVRVTDARGRSRTRSLTVEALGSASGAWTAHAGGPGRDGYNRGETTIRRGVAAQLAYRWRTAVPSAGPVGGALGRQPIVVGTRVYDVQRDGSLAAWDLAATGTDRPPLWTQTVPVSGSSYQNSPVEAAGVLYLVDYHGGLNAVRASDGARLWRVALGVGVGSWDNTHLLVQAGKVLVNVRGDSVIAFDVATGARSWGGGEYATPSPSYHETILLTGDGTRMFMLDRCEVVAVAIATGIEAWRTPIHPGVGCTGYSDVAPIVSAGRVFALTSHGSIAVDAEDGAVRWRSGALTSYGQPKGVIANGAWIVNTHHSQDPSSAWRLGAFDIETGEQLWSAPSDNQLVMAVAGDLIVGASTAGLFGYDLLTGQRLWTAGAPEAGSRQTWWSPTIAGGWILVSTGEGTKAYGLP